MYARRKLHGLKGRAVDFVNLSDGPLSELIEGTRAEVLMLCGPESEMSKEYVMEGIANGWTLSQKYFHKSRSAFFAKPGRLPVNVKHVSHWFGGDLDAAQARDSWEVLDGLFQRHTGLPLLATPAKTGQALLWQCLPQGRTFEALPDETADIIRRNSPQHRLEDFAFNTAGLTVHEYDGRWMYAGLASLDRLPVGAPTPARSFQPYVPGWYLVDFMVPKHWAHIGLLPVKYDDARTGEKRWAFPSRYDGEIHRTWASEPELTLAEKHGWAFEVMDGFQFSKGRPLGEWAKTLVELREVAQLTDEHAAGAIRMILNAGIGSIHRNDYYREMDVTVARYREMVRERGAASVQPIGEYDPDEPGSFVRVAIREKYQDKLSIYMPHWSAQIYALERARIADYCLRVPFSHLVKINGDALYLTNEANFPDNGNNGQLRSKGVKTL